MKSPRNALIGAPVALRFKHNGKFGAVGVVKDAVMQDDDGIKQWLYTVRLHGEPGIRPQLLQNLDRGQFERIAV